MNEILTKIEKLNAYFRNTTTDMTEKERIYSRIIKLSEEVGELCEATLCENDKNQRDKKREISFDKELADVMICCLMLAEDRDNKIWNEIDLKLTKILNRYNLN